MHHLVPYNHREVEKKWDRNQFWHNKLPKNINYKVSSSVYKEKFEDIDLSELKYYIIADVYGRYSSEIMATDDYLSNINNLFDEKLKDVIVEKIKTWKHNDSIVVIDYIPYINITDCYDNLLSFNNVNISTNYKNAQINWIKQNIINLNGMIYLKFGIANENGIIADIDKYICLLNHQSKYFVCSESDNLKIVLPARVISHKLFDEGLVSAKEPFENILVAGGLYFVDEESKHRVKMNCDEYDMRYLYMDYGSDCVSMYLMFIGPLLHNSVWDESALDGIYRFFRRMWNMTIQNIEIGLHNETVDEESKVNLEKFLSDYEDKMNRFQFNIAISEIMSYNKMLCKKTNENSVSAYEIRTLLKMVYPFAPCIASELWERIEHNNSI